MNIMAKQRLTENVLLCLLVAGSLILMPLLTDSVIAQEDVLPAEVPESANIEEVESDIPLAPEEKPKEESKFSYNPQGMRDPFVSLLVTTDLEPRGEGVAGMKISELTLQGIQIGIGKVAIVLGPDGNTYSLRVGDSVFDGKVTQIAGNKLVFEKIIFDAFGREKEKKSIEIYLHRG